MIWDQAVAERLRDRLQRIYGEGGSEYLPKLRAVIEHHQPPSANALRQRWDQRDVVLITYADQIRLAGEPPLITLGQFLEQEQWASLINTVHLLPFYPSSSDDGFAVVDYRAVDAEVGTWQDIQQLGRHHDLMMDLVLNHVSQGNQWFQRYRTGDPQYRNFFIEGDPATDLSQVTRPRSSPLLTTFSTSRGRRSLWTTFSADQIDLNYADPDVLVEIVDILLFYIRQGARFIRLDAIAYLWKEVGTSCIHLPQTHAVVALFRDIVEIVAPHVIILTETNVPHAENISYFGNGDEAHMVYQFSLPPLLLDALLQHDACPFNAWLGNLDATSPGTTYFNFTASHDGIGVRPLEGLVSAPRIQQLVAAARQRGGLISSRRGQDGTDVPYELNITYLDALSDPNAPDSTASVSRFLASQAIMLAMRGIPGVYFHSLVGSHNDAAAVHASRIARRINRHKYDLRELQQRLHTADSPQARIYTGYRRLIATRVAQPAFHPDGHLRPLRPDYRGAIAFVRTSPDESQRILVVANVTDQARSFDLAEAHDFQGARDLLSGAVCRGSEIRLVPYQVAWFAAT